MYKARRISYFTLMELLIAMGLLAALLTSVFGFYSELEKMHQLANKAHESSFERLYVQLRLKDVFSNLYKGKDLIFFTSHEDSAAKGINLIFMYNNGVDIHPWFSQDVLGRLYIDRQGSLCLSTWPSPTAWQKEGNMLEKAPMKREVLLTEIKEIAFEFLALPPIDERTGKNKLDPDADRWVKEWQHLYRELPALVKILIKPMKGKETVFVFPVNIQNDPLQIVR